ncbi:hypothetical protein QQ994_18445 [Pseudomonas asiatica]|uniref:hypothetical protein n=1 Tax=Pseudomonas TaxID=286 RepID=UPI000B1BEDFC|nr:MULTISPECIES: hypothetical protein [Pseudomonas]MDV5099434.1 hypothetical protein [Pseudomonas sp. LSJ-87]WJD68592.1 hypothetical protein QQ994_18445 [Pseudomonas asiatica]
MINIFPRRGLAADMARQLLKPSALDIGLKSGLFFTGCAGPAAAERSVDAITGSTSSGPIPDAGE